MKICIISPVAIETPPTGYGGSEAVVHLLAEELAIHHDVTVIAAKGSKGGRYKLWETIPPTYRGVEGEIDHYNRIIAAQLLTSKHIVEGEIDHYNRYKDFALGQDWDLIMSHEHFFPSYKLKEEKSDFALEWHVHDLLPALSPPPVHVPIYARSKFHAKYLSEKWKRAINFRYNPVDIRKYTSRKRREDWFLFLGRMNEKGALEFIEICKKEQLKGIVAGEDSASKGIDPRTVWRAIKECNNSGLTYLGSISEKKKIEILSKAKGLIIPFTGDYMPVFDLVFVEALASGCPVITRERGAVPEIILHEKTGFIANSLDEIGEYARRVGEISPQACRRQARKFKPDLIVNKYVR